MKIIFPLITSFNTFLAYSLLCKRFAFLTGKDLVVQIYISTVFILAIGFASLALDFLKKPTKFFIPAQILLSFFYLLLPTLLLVSELTLLTAIPWWMTSGLLTIFLGLLSGTELPFYLYKTKLHEKILFFNYAGTLVASLIFIGFAHKSQVLEVICLIMGFSNILICFQFGVSKVKRLISYGLIFVLSLSYLQLNNFEKFTRKASYLQFPIESFSDLKNIYFAVKATPAIFHMETPYQKIDILPKAFYSEEKISRDWGLFLNRRIQIYSDTEDIYHQTMTFLPLLHLPKKPLDILILGGGDLGLVREVSRLPQKFKSLTLVELDPSMIKLAKEGPYLNQMHNTEYQYTFIQNDAFSFLLKNQKKYDLIMADFPFPVNFDLMKLYSQEFYRLVGKSLSSDGLLIFDYPFFTHNSKAHKEGQKIILKTLKSAGYNFQIWGQFETFVLASPGNFPVRKNINTYAENLKSSVLTNFINRTEDFSYDLESVKVNSIFKPVREFSIDQ